MSKEIDMPKRPTKSKYAELRDFYKDHYLSEIISQSLPTDFQIQPSYDFSVKTLAFKYITIYVKEKSALQYMKKFGIKNSQIKEIPDNLKTYYAHYIIKLSPKEVRELGYKIARDNPKITEKVLEGFGEENIRSFEKFKKESDLVLKGIKQSTKRFDEGKISVGKYLGEIDKHERYITQISVKKELMNRAIPNWTKKIKKFEKPTIESKEKTYHKFLEKIGAISERMRFW